jgi:MFS family permease
LTDAAAPAPTVSRYSWYVLFVLVLVYVLNFVDRQIISILANDIKRDLGLTDADLGFLYGTAFGVFYSLFGIPLGKLADGWNRTRLLTFGLALWSIMTTVSGFAKNGMMLTGARIGVGIGEATASPSAYSLLSDWFPKEKRATALAIYSSGLFIGGGISLLIGGQIVERWDAAFPARSGPLGLAGWQAAFMAVGIPGLLLALWVATLREPIRGQADGIPTPPAERPFKGFLDELMTIIPPFTFFSAARYGTGSLISNIAVGLAISGCVAALISVTGTVPQWIAVGIGAYAVYSWASTLRHRDPPTFALIWGTPAYLYSTLGYGLIAFQSYAVSFWAAPYAERVLGVSKSEAGLWVGAPGALAGFLGVIAGGRLADHFRKTNPSGRLLVVLIAPLFSIVPFFIAFTTTEPVILYVGHFFAVIFTSASLGGTAATTQDLVLPRMRGVSTATFFVATTLVGLSLGPYMAVFRPASCRLRRPPLSLRSCSSLPIARFQRPKLRCWIARALWAKQSSLRAARPSDSQSRRAGPLPADRYCADRRAPCSSLQSQAV